MPSSKTKTAKQPTGHRTPRRHEGDPTTQFAVIVFKLGDAVPKKLWHDDPVDALAGAVVYLKEGYQVRLSDLTVEHFRSLPREGK
jgi:hypothetical protein